MSDVTKRALEESLKRLLKDKPLDKITIAELTDDCGISRMTFYYHFRDIYDLVEWSCQEDASKVLAGNKTYNTWQEGFLQILYYVRDNADFIGNVYRSVSRDKVEKYLYEVTYRLLRDVVDEEAQGMNVSEENKRFIADLYKYAFVGLVIDWFRGGMQEEPEAFIDRLAAVMHGNIPRALEALRFDSDRA
jgi:probable dihydroxyacetone kinase regulator